MKAGSLFLFWAIWKTRNIITFEDDVIPIQKQKGSFVCFLWLETILFVQNGPKMLCRYIDWLSSW